MYLLKVAAFEVAKLVLAGAVFGLGVMLGGFGAPGLALVGIVLSVAGVGAGAILLFAWATVLYEWQRGEVARFAGDWVDGEVDRRVEAELDRFDAEVVDRLANERLAEKRAKLVRDANETAGADCKSHKYLAAL